MTILEKNNSGDGFGTNTVLIVDDTPMNLGVIVDYLKAYNFKTAIASNGELAIKRAKYLQPDIILLDVMMPGIDGYETCRRLKEDSETKDIPIIFMTALIEPEDKTRAFSVGGVDYITKPVQREEVLARITTHLEIRRYREHLEDEVKKRTIALENRTIELEQAEKVLKESEQRFRSLVETTSDWVWEVEKNCVYTYVSPKVKDILGYESDEIIGKTAFDLFPKSGSEEVAGMFENIVKSKQPFTQFEKPIFNKNGEQIVLESSGVPIFDEQNRLSGYRGIDRDITTRKKVEEALLVSEEQYRTLVENINVGICRSTTDHEGEGKFLQANTAIARIFGYDSVKELMATPIKELYQNEEDRTRFIEQMKREGFCKNLELLLKKKDGSLIWGLISCMVQYDQGHDIKWLDIVVEDITERKQAEQILKELNKELEKKVQNGTHKLELSLEELKETQKHLIETKKMASLGGLVAGVAHEINTPVGIGITASSFLKDKTGDFIDNYKGGNLKKKELDRYLNIASESTDSILFNLKRAANLIQSFKVVAVDQSTEEVREFQLSHIIENTLLSLHNKLGQTKHDVVVNCSDKLLIRSYPGVYSLIFNNLLLNTLNHGFESTQQGKIEIEAFEDKNKLILLYRDNGQGMGKNIVEKIFEPFFTTARGRGNTGLGMHIVYNMVTQKLNGSIHCTSQKGEGASFKITVPLEQHNTP